MKIYHQTKLGRKRIISSEDRSKQSYSDYTSPHCDLGNSNPIFFQDTPAYADVPPYHVWFQKVQGFRRYNPDKH